MERVLKLGIIDVPLSELYKKAVTSEFVRKVGETFTARILLIGIGLITSVLVARILGPEGRGLFAVASTIGAIGVQFGNLGLHASNTYSVAKDRNLLPKLIGNTLLVSFGLGGAGSAAVWTVFKIWPSFSPVQELLLAMSLLWIPFGLAYMLLQNLLIGIHDVRSYNKIEVLTKCLSVAFIGVVLFARGVSVEMVFACGLLALMISFAWALGKLLSGLKDHPVVSCELFKENFSYGIKAYLSALFSFLALRISLLMIRYQLGAEQTGYFSIAVTMSDMVSMLPVVIGTILFPKLASMQEQQAKLNLAIRIAAIVAIMMVIITTIASFASALVVKGLYGSAFVPAVPAFVLLMPGIVLLSVNVIFMNYFAAIGMPPITVYSPAFGLLLNVVGNMILIPLIGINGAALSSTVCCGLMLTLSIVFIMRMRGDSNGRL